MNDNKAIISFEPSSDIIIDKSISNKKIDEIYTMLFGLNNSEYTKKIYKHVYYCFYLLLIIIGISIFIPIPETIELLILSFGFYTFFMSTFFFIYFSITYLKPDIYFLLPIGKFNRLISMTTIIFVILNLYYILFNYSSNLNFVLINITILLWVLFILQPIKTHQNINKKLSNEIITNHTEKITNKDIIIGQDNKLYKFISLETKNENTNISIIASEIKTVNKNEVNSNTIFKTLNKKSTHAFASNKDKNVSNTREKTMLNSENNSSLSENDLKILREIREKASPNNPYKLKPSELEKLEKHDLLEKYFEIYT